MFEKDTLKAVQLVNPKYHFEGIKKAPYESNEKHHWKDSYGTCLFDRKERAYFSLYNSRKS